MPGWSGARACILLPGRFGGRLSGLKAATSRFLAAHLLLRDSKNVSVKKKLEGAALLSSVEPFIAPSSEVGTSDLKVGQALDDARVMVRARAAAQANDQLAFARAFCLRMVTSWWGRLRPEHVPLDELRAPLVPFERGELSSADTSLADAMAEMAARLDVATAAYHIGLVYTGMLAKDYRSSLGVYYTPPALVARLLDQSTAAGIDWSRCRVLDPACGGGAFLAPVARRIISQLETCSPSILVKNIGTRLRGYELDPFAAWLSQVTLDAVMLPIVTKAGSRLPVVVSVTDSLTKRVPREKFDLVIGNPPYGKVRLAPDLRQQYRRSLFGHANLYGLFTDVAVRHSKPGGVIAYVTPTSFLAGEYFKNLRELMGRLAAPVSIDFVSVRKGVFDDVLQETLLATYRRAPSTELVKVSEITPSVDGSITVHETGHFPLPAVPASPWIVPRSSSDAALVNALAAREHRLRNWGYRVSTGPLVWNRHKDQLATRAGRNRWPLIWAEAVTSNGQFVWRATKRNHTPYFAVQPGDEWLIARAPCVLLQRTTAKEQSRRLIAAELPQDFLDAHGAAVVENHLNMLRPINGEPRVSPATLAAFLNSSAADRAFRCVSGSVAVSAYELEALPLPDPAALQCLDQLVASGASRDVIDAECVRLYAAE